MSAVGTPRSRTRRGSTMASPPWASAQRGPLYVGAYFTLVEGGVQEDMAGRWVVIPTYRFGGKFSACLFNPLYQMDQQLRTEYWSEPSLVRRLFTSRR